MNWESSIVRLSNIIWHRRRRGHYGEGFHNSIRIFLSNFRNEESSHSWSCSTSQRVSNLEDLKTVTSLSLFSNNIQYRINQLCTLGIMSFCPVVSCSCLPEDEVVRSKKLTERSSSDRVHSSRLKIHENNSRDISPSSGFIVVNIDSLQL